MEKLKFERQKTMKKGFKRGLRVLVVVLMLISMIPMGVMAEEATAVNGALVNQREESVDSQEESTITPIPNSLTESFQTNGYLYEGDFVYLGCIGGVFISSYTGAGGDVVIPDTLGGKKVVSISSAFSRCSSLTSITIPNSITDIASHGFYGCSSLTMINLPDNLTSIGWNAFNGCSSLTNVTIPDSLTSIDFGAFDGCSSLTTINIPDSVASIGSWAFNGCSSLTNINIPDSLTSIGYRVFDGCSSLTTITIPDNVTSIDKNAFYGCSSLTNVTIPDSVTSIGSSAFDGCASLTTVNIPDSLISIEDRVFDGCSSLTNITIPDTLTSIGMYAFGECSSLTNITIPDSVTSIGSCAFHGCASLTTITIPDSVTTIGSDAFLGCSSLISINVDINNLNYSSLDGVLFDKAITTLIACPDEKVSFTIPDSVTGIGSQAFSGCSSLTNVVIPDGVTYIGSSAFGGCSSLTTIHLPDSVKSIGRSAFWGCSSFTNIIIPDSVMRIIDGAFYGCSSLASIQINSANTIIDDYSVYMFPETATIIGYDPSTAKEYADKHGNPFQLINAVKTLKQIAITSSAQKLVYKVGETLDLTGLSVVGTYSDGTTRQVAFTSDNIIGFDSSYPETNQVLTIAVEGITTTYTVQIIASDEASQGELTAFLLKDINGNFYEYGKDDVNYSFVVFQMNQELPRAKMYQHFSGILAGGGKVVGLKDADKGYMDYQAVVTAFMSAQIAGKPFEMNSYLALNNAKKLTETVENVQVVDKDGNIS